MRAPSLRSPGCRNPCNQLDDVDPRLLGHVAIKQPDGSILRKAGIMGIVVEGGAVRPGDPIRVEMPAAPSPAPLQPISTRLLLELPARAPP